MSRRRVQLTVAGAAALGLTTGSPLVASGPGQPARPTPAAASRAAAHVAAPAVNRAATHAFALRLNAGRPGAPAGSAPTGTSIANAGPGGPRFTADVPVTSAAPGVAAGALTSGALKTAAALPRQAPPGRPRPSIPNAGRVIQLRPSDVRLLVDGRLVAQRFRPRGGMTLGRLARLAGRRDWLSVNRGVAVLRAAIYQAPGTAFTIAAADAKTLRLVQDDTGYGGVIEGTGAGLNIDGVTVVGWDEAAGRPASESLVRPYLEYHRGSQVALRNASFNSLGRPVPLQEGVAVYDSTALFASNTSFARSRSGLVAVRTRKVRLDQVSANVNTTNGITVRQCPAPLVRRTSATGNRGNGIFIDGSPDAVLASVRAVRNANVGLSLRAVQRPMASAVSVAENGSGGIHMRATTGGVFSNVATTRNRRAGVEVIGSSAVRVDGVRSSANQGAGVDVTSSSGVELRGLTSTADVAGLLVRVGSHDVTATSIAVDRTLVAVNLGGPRIRISDVSVDRAATGLRLAQDGVSQRADDVRVSRSGIGVQVAAGNRDSALAQVQIRESTQFGVDLQGSRTSLKRATVEGGDTAVIARGNAAGITLSGVTARLAQTGIEIQSQVTDVAIDDLTVDHATVGLDSSAARTRVTGGQLSEVVTGVKVRSDAVLRDVNIDAEDCAVRAVDTTPLLQGGSIRGVRAVCGAANLDQTRILAPRTPNAYGLFAGGMVALAIAYELLRRRRERPRRTHLRSAVASKGAGS